MNFGKGIPLWQMHPRLRNTAERHAIIMDCVERDSIIEGLPPFTPELKAQLLRELQELARSK